MLTERERILRKASPEPNTGCWLWTEGDNGRGYGRVHYKGSSAQAHRAMYEILVGPIPDGCELDHRCRQTFCVNPDHLDPVPHAVNVRRGRTGRVNAARQRSKTHCPYGHPYEGDNVIVRPKANNARCCKECRRIGDRNRRAECNAENSAIRRLKRRGLTHREAKEQVRLGLTF